MNFIPLGRRLQKGSPCESRPSHGSIFCHNPDCKISRQLCVKGADRILAAEVPGGVEEEQKEASVYVTDRRRLGVLLPEAGLSEPDPVSKSSADDQDDRSWGNTKLKLYFKNESLYVSQSQK